MRIVLTSTVAVVGQVLIAAARLQQSQPLVPRPVLKLIVDHPALAPYLPRGRRPGAAGCVRPSVGARRHAIQVRSAATDRSRPRGGYSAAPPDPELRSGRLPGEGRGGIPSGRRAGGFQFEARLKRMVDAPTQRWSPT